MAGTPDHMNPRSKAFSLYRLAFDHTPPMRQRWLVIIGVGEGRLADLG